MLRINICVDVFDTERGEVLLSHKHFSFTVPKPSGTQLDVPWRTYLNPEVGESIIHHATLHAMRELNRIDNEENQDEK